MSGRWFRLYDDTINNPKALKLSDKTFRIWIGILCIASKNGGKLPCFDDIAIMLRMKPPKLQPEIEKLIAAELLDHDDDGLRPHDWNERQYKSDVSTERVKRFRNAERNVSETPPETETETETENRKEKKDSRTVAKATRPKLSEDFDNFWKAYPRRLGANPKTPASKVFLAAVKQGADPAAIIEGARRCAVSDHDKIGTPYIPQAVKWLRDQRWADYAAGPPASPSLQAPAGAPTHDELRKKYERSAALPAETETQTPVGANGSRADHGQELRPTGAGIRPSIRTF